MTFWNVFWILFGVIGAGILVVCISFLFIFLFCACRVSGMAEQAAELYTTDEENDHGI